MVCIYVAGLLLVVGGVVVQSDETDRVWSEALLLLHVAVANSNLDYTNIGIYTIHIASISLFPFFRNDLQHLVLGRDGASFVPGLASPIPCPLLLSF